MFRELLSPLPAPMWPCMGFRVFPQTPLGKMTITHSYTYISSGESG